VTRPEGQSRELAVRLEELGHEVVLCPLVRIEPLGDEPVDVTGYDWVIVTSANGADELARRLRGRPVRIAAVGPVTAADADFVPLYRTVELRPDEPPAGDLVVLASGSAARAFAALGVDLPAVTIGPQTTATAHECGIRVAAEAETHDLDGLVRAVARLAP